MSIPYSILSFVTLSCEVLIGSILKTFYFFIGGSFSKFYLFSSFWLVMYYNVAVSLLNGILFVRQYALSKNISIPFIREQ